MRHWRSGDFACPCQHHPHVSIKTLHEAIIFSQAHKVSELICFHICLLYTSLHDPPVPKITIDIQLEEVITFDLGSVQLFSNCERNHGPSSTLMSNSGLDHTRFKFERVQTIKYPLCQSLNTTLVSDLIRDVHIWLLTMVSIVK